MAPRDATAPANRRGFAFLNGADSSKIKTDGERVFPYPPRISCSLTENQRMAPFDDLDLRTQAAVELNEQVGRMDGARVVDSLAEGLRSLRGLLCLRLREDVEQNFGLDSLNLPSSAMEAERRLEREIDWYQAAVAALHACERGYVQADPAWCAAWVARMGRPDFHHSPEGRERLAQYLDLSRQEQRLHFANLLLKVTPEAGRAPLVLFRLYPAAIRAVTSTAFGDEQGAADVRTQQRAILPSIDDCHQCHAAVLDNGEVCPTCSNPLWTYNYLTTAD